MDYRHIMNDPMLWAVCIPAVSMTVVQALLFFFRAKKVAPAVGLTNQEIFKAFRVGLVSAIGPAMSSAVVMLTLISAIGGAFTWLRLCFIGSAMTEFIAADLGAKAVGMAINTENYNVLGFSASVWAMTLNAMGWLLFVAFFTPKLDIIRKKLVGEDSKLMGVVAASALVGSMSFLSVGEATRSMTSAIVFVACASLMFVVMLVTKKIPALREHVLTIVLSFGIILACVILYVNGGAR